MWCAVSCIWRGVALIIIIMSMIINIICSIIFIRRFALLYQIHTTELNVAIFKYICQTYPSSCYTSKSKVRAQCLVWRGELRAHNCQWKCSFFSYKRIYLVQIGPASHVLVLLHYTKIYKKWVWISQIFFSDLTKCIKNSICIQCSDHRLLPRLQHTDSHSQCYNLPQTFRNQIACVCHIQCKSSYY